MPRIHAITPFTMLDYPGEMACIVWFAKCNFRCVYCHNPDIVLSQGSIEDETLQAFLKKRVGQLTGVVLSGGEPTMCAELLTYAAMAKELGYKVKIDTNGTNPEAMRELVRHGFIDYVALDYKGPVDKLEKLIGTTKFVAAFEETLLFLIDLLKEQKIQLEIRTTYHSDYMNEDDLNKIISSLDENGYTGVYHIQNIVSTGSDTLGQIETPARKLDTGLLIKPQKFTVNFRNFKHIKA